MSDGMDYSEKACHRCGKTFIIHSARDWVFKRNVKGEKFFCSWSCVRAWDDSRGSKIERRQQIIDGLFDGLSVDEICRKYDADKTTVLYWKNKLMPKRKDENPEDDEVYGGW